MCDHNCNQGRNCHCVHSAKRLKTLTVTEKLPPPSNPGFRTFTVAMEGKTLFTVSGFGHDMVDVMALLKAAPEMVAPVRRGRTWVGNSPNSRYGVWGH